MLKFAIFVLIFLVQGNISEIAKPDSEYFENLVKSMVGKMTSEFQVKLEKIEKENQNLRHENQMIKNENVELKNRVEILETRIEIVENKDVEERLEHVEELSKLKTVRTCEELARHGVKKSGRYLIDPDGDLLGQDPIEVICDFETNTTEVPHDSEELIKIEKCESTGCSRYEIGYYASMSQIQSLIQLSEKCEQEISFGCFLAPLSYEGTNYGWWEDRTGFERYFFSGDNIGLHTCSCGKNTQSTNCENKILEFSLQVKLILVLNLPFRIFAVIVTAKIRPGTWTRDQLQQKKFYQSRLLHMVL